MGTIEQTTIDQLKALAAADGYHTVEKESANNPSLEVPVSEEQTTLDRLKALAAAHGYHAEQYFAALEMDDEKQAAYQKGAMDALNGAALNFGVEGLKEKALATYFSDQLTKRLVEKTLLRDHVAESARREISSLLYELMIETK